MNKEWHYKFEDLKHVTGRDIDMGYVDGEGSLDPNDEYYPRQKVDEAICELDAHRLCFDTDRKTYLKRYEEASKRWMAYEKRLFHSNYMRCRYNVKECHKSLLQWQKACEVVSNSPEALEKATEKVALWTKWEARWRELANRYGGNYDDA